MAIFTGNACARVLFNKVSGLACYVIKKDTPTQLSACEYCEIFKSRILYRTPPVSDFFNHFIEDKLFVICKILSGLEPNLTLQWMIDKLRWRHILIYAKVIKNLYSHIEKLYLLDYAGGKTVLSLISSDCLISCVTFQF